MKRMVLLLLAHVLCANGQDVTPLTDDLNVNVPGDFPDLQSAHDYVQEHYDLGHRQSVIYHCGGAFTKGVIESGPLKGQIHQLNEQYVFTPGSTVTVAQGQCAFTALNGAMFSVIPTDGNLTIIARGGVGGAASQGGILYIGNGVTFWGCDIASVLSSWGGSVYVDGFYTVGNAQAFALASGGLIQLNPGFTSYVVGYPVYTYGFLWAYNGTIGTDQIFAGISQGPGARAELNGVITSGSALPNHTVITSTGGQFIGAH